MSSSFFKSKGSSSKEAANSASANTVSKANYQKLEQERNLLKITLDYVAKENEGLKGHMEDMKMTVKHNKDLLKEYVDKITNKDKVVEKMNATIEQLTSRMQSLEEFIKQSKAKANNNCANCEKNKNNKGNDKNSETSPNSNTMTSNTNTVSVSQTNTVNQKENSTTVTNLTNLTNNTNNTNITPHITAFIPPGRRDQGQHAVSNRNNDDKLKEVGMNK
jgi:chromosome segregation ATPase